MFQTNVVCFKVNVNDVINWCPVSMHLNNLVFVKEERYRQNEYLKTSNGHRQHNDQTKEDKKKIIYDTKQKVKN